jgi:hypothetical protein
MDQPGAHTIALWTLAKDQPEMPYADFVYLTFRRVVLAERIYDGCE